MWYKNSGEFKSAMGHEVAGVWYPRVTKILDIKSKPGLEHFWKEMDSFASAQDVTNKSAAQGSLVHETIQGLVTGKLVAIPKEIEPSISAFQKFNEIRGIAFHPDFIERSLWSLRHRYSGTIDALATIDGKFGVLDIKTSTGFFPEYNLQTAAYVSALQEFSIKRTLSLPCDIETRWILRVNQHQVCRRCGATLREKGGRSKIRTGFQNGKKNSHPACTNGAHEWGALEGDVELKEFPYHYNDMKAFIAAKILWEWENGYWLKQVGYLN